MSSVAPSKRQRAPERQGSGTLVRHPVESLFSKLDAIVDAYPNGIGKLETRIGGPMFFPGGAGLWSCTADGPLPTMPRRGTMVLGPIFDRGEEDRGGPTWRGLQQLLVGFDPNDCFFTNFFAGVVSEAGASPSSPWFFVQCREMWIEQLRAQRPSLVLALGARVPALIADLSAELMHFRGAKSLAQLDAEGHAWIDNVTVDGLPPFAIAAVTPLSFRHLNVGKRRWAGRIGADAERVILEEARRAADRLRKRGR
jgi:hypothetical protein